MNKLKTSAMTVVLSALLVFSGTQNMSNPANELYNTDSRLSEQIKVGSIAQNFETLEAEKAKKAEQERLAELERIKQEELKRQQEIKLASRGGQERTYLGEFEITFYCSCATCCGRANKPCANGQYPVEGVTIAAPQRFKFGTKLYIEGIGERVVMDRGSAIKGNKIDVYVTDHQRAIQLGRKRNVKVYTKELITR